MKTALNEKRDREDDGRKPPYQTEWGLAVRAERERRQSKEVRSSIVTESHPALLDLYISSQSPSVLSAPDSSTLICRAVLDTVL